MFKIFKREPGFYGRLLRLALPLLLQNLISNSMGLLDTFMVGTLGEGPLAGVTLANIPVFVIQLLMFGIQSGSSVLISQHWGKGDKDTINRVMGIGMYAAGGITLLFAAITQTGALDLLARKIIALAGNKMWVLPIMAHRSGRASAG